MKKEKNYGERVLAMDVTVSNDTRITGLNNNDLIIGSSGAGKTGGYVIPNLQNITGSLVVSDTKGLLERMFKKELMEKGYEVRTIDLVNPRCSCGYNPLDFIRRCEDGSIREQDILSLAHALVPTLDKEEPFWEQAARGYLSFLIAYCMEILDEDEQNMISVCELHRTFLRPGGKEAMVYRLEGKRESFAQKKYDHLVATKNADKMWSSIMEFATRALENYEFQEAKYIFQNADRFDIADLGKKKTVLFLNISDTDRTFDNFINIFYTQALQVLCDLANQNSDGRLEVPVRIIMDDFATGSTIEHFDKIISVIRSRDISVSLVLQSMTQLETMYSKATATTIINNCDHLLYLGTQDVDTANYIGARAFKMPEEILCMPRERAYLLTNGEKARLVKKVKPYSTLNRQAPVKKKEEKQEYEHS